MFIIDFDDTLFDTHAFKKARLEALLAIGVGEEDYQKTYKLARNNSAGVFTYSDQRHAEILEVHGYDKEKCLQVLKTVTENLAKFLREDAIDFLEELKQKSETMILLSLGDPSFQELKVKNSGIHDYFDRTFMVDDTKIHVVEEIIDGVKDKAIWFVNDKVGETEEIVSKFPQVKAVLRISDNFPESEYYNSDIPAFKSLKEINDFISNNK